MFAREFRLIFSAWMQSTRIPLPPRLRAWIGEDAAEARAAARYFPLIGILIGAAGGGVFALGMWQLTPVVAVALSMATTALITGAVFERGFAKVCDGIAGRAEGEARLGGGGAISIALVLLIKFSALLSLAENDDAELTTWIMIAAQALSRTISVLLMRWLGERVPAAEVLGIPEMVTGPATEASSAPEPELLGAIHPLPESGVETSFDADMASGIESALTTETTAEKPPEPPAAAASPTATPRPVKPISLFGMLVALLFGASPLALLAYAYDDGWLFATGALPMALLAPLLGWWFRRRAGSYGVGSAGGVQQVTELVFYVVAVALLTVPADDGG
jgi:adenosylcobinamide-GDP ribazoletransferase